MREHDPGLDHTVAWRELARVVGPVGQGCSRVVPVLGSGARSWAGGRVLPGWFTDWEALIQRLAADIGLQDFSLSGSLTDDFERIVDAYCALHPGDEPMEVENLLIARHVSRLLSVEPFARSPALGRSVRHLLGFGWMDVIDLGIDDVFSRAAGPENIVVGSLSGARSTVATDPSGIRFWHPHGFVRAERAASQVVLGAERYGRSVAAAVSAYRSHARWVQQHPAHVGQDVRTVGAPVDHWVPLALHTPLLLLGTSLGADDWDLLWFLRMRRRAQAIYRVDTPVFRLTCGADTDARRLEAVRETTGIVPLHGGATWKEAWARLFGTLTGAP